MKNRKTFAVTGGAGLVGRHLTQELINRGHSVKIIDNLSNSRKEFIENMKGDVDFFRLDIREKKELEKRICNTDGIFHQAALISTDKSKQYKNEYTQVNVEGSKNVFDIALKFKIKVVFASSASVYGNTKKIPIKETQKKIPVSTYGRTKLECERIAQEYAKSELEVMGLRYFNVYGEEHLQGNAGVITKFIHQIKELKNIDVFGKGQQKRDFIHVRDVVNANVIAMEKNISHKIINVGSGKSISILDLAKMMLKISEIRCGINIHEHKQPGILLSESDITAIKKELGWEPKIQLKNWLKKELT